MTAESRVNSRRVPFDKSEGSVKGRMVLAVAGRRFFAREVEDQDSGNLTLNHLSVEDRSTNHRFGHNSNHDSSMRTSRLVQDAAYPEDRSHREQPAGAPGRRKLDR